MSEYIGVKEHIRILGEHKIVKLNSLKKLLKWINENKILNVEQSHRTDNYPVVFVDDLIDKIKEVFNDE